MRGRLPLRGCFHNNKHQDWFKSNAAHNDAVVQYSFFPCPGKHVHGQWGGNSERKYTKYYTSRSKLSVLLSNLTSVSLASHSNYFPLLCKESFCFVWIWVSFSGGSTNGRRRTFLWVAADGRTTSQRNEACGLSRVTRRASTKDTEQERLWMIAVSSSVKSWCVICNSADTSEVIIIKAALALLLLVQCVLYQWKWLWMGLNPFHETEFSQSTWLARLDLSSIYEYTYVSNTAKMNMTMKNNRLEVRTATWSMLSSDSSRISTLSTRDRREGFKKQN